ncbi:M15 family metallopeptidase [Microbacterium sp.]|uniref:M15 family metallopeptidase n=1 Tax=Microbacterium sp. TaxID=51671 RepID=UPI0039E5F7C6
MSEPEPPPEPSPERADRVRAWSAAAVAAVLVVGTAVALVAAFAGPVVGAGEAVGGWTEADGTGAGTAAPTVSALPVPDQITDDTDDTDAADGADEAGQAITGAPCDDPAVVAALGEGRDADVITAVGGGAAFRDLVVAGAAPCVSLGEAGRLWVVVNKQRPLDPLDYAPDSLARAEGVQRTSGVQERADVADALEGLAAAAEAEGAGTVGINSGFRSYRSQQSTFNGYVGSLGRAQAELVSARAGYSEHQTGLAVDIVACSRGCGSLEQFAGTSQATWLADNAWRFGFIVRYEQGMTGVTGYDWEPWHVRYVGVELAKAYHDGGYHTLEEFFGLPAAPGYLD